MLIAFGISSYSPFGFIRIYLIDGRGGMMMGLLYDLAEKIREAKSRGENKVKSFTSKESDKDDRSESSQNISGSVSLRTDGQNS
jgi:hypothetical protein